MCLFGHMQSVPCCCNAHSFCVSDALDAVIRVVCVVINYVLLSSATDGSADTPLQVWMPCGSLW